MRRWFPLVILLGGPLARPVASQADPAALEGILRAEAVRANSAAGVETILRGLRADDTVLQLAAIRALGRLQRPALAVHLLPLLAHPEAAVRGEVLQAVAQSVQAFRGDSLGRAHSTSWPALLTELGRRVSLEADPGVRGMLALSLGRLPYGTGEERLQAQEWLVALAAGLRGPGAPLVARGMESFARGAARSTPFAERFLAPLRATAQDERAPAPARRSALGALLLAQEADRATFEQTIRAADPQLRRLALTGVVRVEDATLRDRLLESGSRDSSFLVRYEALRQWSRIEAARPCTRLLEATRDSVMAITLLALDAVGVACREQPGAVPVLEATLAAEGAWHPTAHALVSLTRLAPSRAAIPVARGAASAVWQVRMYAARAAQLLRDTVTLERLAADAVANVREAALGGLHDVLGHAADAHFRAALEARDYQLVLSAANALQGSPAREAGAVAALRALERISRERSETSRDPRLALLARVGELGSAALADRLRPFLRDFDPAIADSAARLLGRWTGRTERARPRPLAPLGFSLAELAQHRGKRLLFTMASGAEFEIELLVDAAPLTVLRVTRLAALGYYNGLSFHRVVPNFVIQGGSPGANEYAGHSRFLVDEVSSLSHERGTLGISTRGRDTGDAQLFINLVDNPRLDYDYTVWARVVNGMDTVDRVLEGDTIRRVELRPR